MFSPAEVAQLVTPMLAAAVAIAGVMFTLRQKDRSERRAEWWRRATWALERIENDRDGEIAIGWAILAGLLESNLATDSENTIIGALAKELARMNDD